MDAVLLTVIVFVVIGALVVFICISSTIGEAQATYDKKCEEIKNKFNALNNNNNNNNNNNAPFESMGNCLLEVDKIITDMNKTTSKFAMKRIKKKTDDVCFMYSELLQKLYAEFEQSFMNNCDFARLLQLICYMQDSTKFKPQIHYNSNISETDENNKKQIQLYYKKIEDKLFADFTKIGTEFLSHTTYMSFIVSLHNVIDKCDTFIKTFAKYEIQPQNVGRYVSYMRNIVELLFDLRMRVIMADDSYMIDDENYGKCDTEFLSFVNTLNIQNINKMLFSLDDGIANGDFIKITDIDLKELSGYVWYFAMQKPFSSEAFERICGLYLGFFKDKYTAELLLARLYYIKQMGGDTIIKNEINDLIDEKNGKIRWMIKYNVVIDKIGGSRDELSNIIRKHTSLSHEEVEKIVSGNTSIVKEEIDYNQAISIVYDLNRCGSFASIKYHHNSSSKLLTTIASGLMWMGAYDSEKKILEYMLSKQLPMTQKQQQRLHSLNNGGGVAPKSFDLLSDANKLYFDISSISWRDEEYKGFFENLAFEEKILTYSIAVRDEDKELLVTKKITVPSISEALDKIKEVIKEEYDGTVKADLCSCCALSGITTEELSGILVQSSECVQLGLLVHMSCIGKKLTIKFFTLFMPTANDLAVQKQQVLSLHKKMSPTITMWENSMKDAVLIAFQQLLNALPSTNVAVSKQNEVEF